MNPGVSIDASFKVTILTTKAMVTLPTYRSHFYIKYSISNTKVETPWLAVTETQTIEIFYKDACGTPTVSSFTPFVV